MCGLNLEHGFLGSLADTNLKKAGIDSSDRLYTLLRSLGDNPKEFLAEFQVSFVVFLIGQVVSGIRRIRAMERPVTTATIDCLSDSVEPCLKLLSCLIFVLAPIVVTILVLDRKISPWWLFLGCGPLALLLCLGVSAWIGMIVLENCVPRPAKKNKRITQAATV
ncbi:AAR2 protein domain-containing protein [Ditylenchus destructor]|uniref:AAR2 protein domain-containing protein n=1 Tax=Ditylenchus destructor TaxID=166010 RepID=A0AAD4MYR0_9BILA|nr:AAR2 protein domain-containing protein [Ditylenchus destructor]